LGQAIEMASQPLLWKSDRGRLANRLCIFCTVGKRHRWIDPDQFDARCCEMRKHRCVCTRCAFECSKESQNVLSLAIRLEWSEPRRKTNSLDKLAKIDHDCRVVVRRECVLHHDHVFVAFGRGYAAQEIRKRFPYTAFAEQALDVHAVQRGQSN